MAPIFFKIGILQAIISFKNLHDGFTLLNFLVFYEVGC